MESEGRIGRCFWWVCECRCFWFGFKEFHQLTGHQVYNKPTIQQFFATTTSPPLYMTHPIPHRPLTSVRFCPFQDILTVGHSNGLSSVLVPGSGEPNFDSSEADPFENKRMRREREVKGLLDKVFTMSLIHSLPMLMCNVQIQPDMIALDPEFVGSMAPPTKLTTSTNGKPDIPFARLPRQHRLKLQGRADETEEVSEEEDGEEGKEGKAARKEEKEKKRMKGKNKAMKRYLRKQRKNVIDPNAVRISSRLSFIFPAHCFPLKVALREKLQKEREQRKKARDTAKGVQEDRLPSALDRFLT